jgi:hypothetical protein
MRIWSLHPRYLDRQGLLGCWRESLLAQSVIRGDTKGYRHHPQLIRFLTCPVPLSAIATYLVSLADEAEKRGYKFDKTKIYPGRLPTKIAVSRGQVLYEWAHLKAKLSLRDPVWLKKIAGIKNPEAHPMFNIVAGSVETWEKGNLLESVV